MYTQCLFSYQGEIKNKDITFIFLPDFRQKVTLYQKGSKTEFFTDSGPYFYKSRPEDGEYHEIYAPRGIEWFLEKNQNVFTFFVVPWTSGIITQFGEPFDIELDNIFRQARKEYCIRKQKEMRLYFYDSLTGQLTNICNDDNDDIENFEYPYDLSDRWVKDNFIGKEFFEETGDCFILGKVKTTLGASGGELINVIEPVARFFEQEGIKRDEIGKILLDLLKFMLHPETKHSSINASINHAFYKGDVKRLRSLHWLIF